MMKMKRLLMAILCVMLMVLFAGCAEKVEADSLQDAHFGLIEDECLQLTQEKMSKFAQSQAQFFFEGASQYAAGDYTVEEILLTRHVFSFKNDDGKDCLALPFAAKISCQHENGTAEIWNMIILVEPTWEDGNLEVTEYALQSNFYAFYADGLYDSMLDAIEGDFTRANPDATVHICE